jgi:SAM-dependent methyltransferase
MTTTSGAAIAFTGEFFLPGEADARIAADHLERYRFAAHHAAGATVLDIACGAGYAGPLLIAAGAVAYQGVDLNPVLVDFAKSEYGATGIDYSHGDICTYTNGATYSLITCFETIEHVADYRAALKNLWQLLEPGGTLLISSPNRPITSPKARLLTDRPANRFHTQEFTPQELLSELRAAGFVADDVYGQRQRRVFRPHFLNRLVKSLTNPNRRASPVVSPVTNKSPRYMVIVARKPRC